MSEFKKWYNEEKDRLDGLDCIELMGVAWDASRHQLRKENRELGLRVTKLMHEKQNQRVRLESLNRELLDFVKSIADGESPWSMFDLKDLIKKAEETNKGENDE